VQVPLVHTSVVVQALPSSHAVLFATGDAAHAPPVHTPVLHALVKDEQFIGEPTH
jgi:hypothetical protein